MKSFSHIFLLLGLLSVSLSTMAQSRNYKHIAQSGEIKDEKGLTIGTVSKDQIIKDFNGQKIAFIDNQGNLIDAKTNKKMGRMGKDGKNYYNAEGELEFKMKDNGNTCEIFNAAGKKIGDVHSSLKASACALACFQEKHRKHS
ncbi:hypothetical protein GCM10028803_29220 [Larkinella knui]|uniref:WG repeat-containing protein n=1 Tax=Larkinella knui TaxID=2025310 RepID=A0A3P1CXB7_9BACT|nr:hypothetical protein [Larkinella knui]RRB17955.1 hypothetical protein EHT87_06685 [Larkinella knui]